MQINLYFMRKQFRQSIARWTSSAGAGFGSSLAIVLYIMKEFIEIGAAPLGRIAHCVVPKVCK